MDLGTRILYALYSTLAEQKGCSSVVLKIEKENDTHEETGISAEADRSA